MAFGISSAAQLANASPTVSLEKGGYRMRAPRTRLSTVALMKSLSDGDSGGKGKGMHSSSGSIDGLRNKGAREVVSSSQLLIMLLGLCAFASCGCFAVAWYLLHSNKRS